MWRKLWLSNNTNEITHDSAIMLLHRNNCGRFHIKVLRAHGKKVIPNTRKRVTNCHIIFVCAHSKPWKSPPKKAPKLINKKKSSHKELEVFLFFSRIVNAKSRFSNERRKSVMEVVGSNTVSFCHFLEALCIWHSS